MEVEIYESRDLVAKRAARLIAQRIRDHPELVLGLATGATIRPIYDLLATHHHGRTGLSFARTQAFMLDEYVGLAAEHPARYDRELRMDLWSRVDADPDRLRTIDGTSDDLQAEAKRYEACIQAAGGIDLQLLGIGVDGHIGFNEPSSSLGSRTRVETLHESTRVANQGYFPSGEDVPFHAITQGVGTILDASELVLIANGAAKAPALADAIEGPITASVPASALQLHQRVRVLADSDAACNLRRLDYYQWVQAHKPAS